MDFSFRGHQFLAHWIPGFFLLCMLYVCDWHFSFGCFDRIESKFAEQPPKALGTPPPMSSPNATSTSTTISTPPEQPNAANRALDRESGGFAEKTFTVLLFVAVVFVLGQFIDAIRDILEDSGLLFGKGKIQWQKLPTMQADERQAWDDYFFSYYIFAANMVIAAIVAVAFSAVGSLTCPNHYWAAAVIGFCIITAVFLKDARTLRRDVVHILEKSEERATPPPEAPSRPREDGE
jgi:hypothetical protein